MSRIHLFEFEDLAWCPQFIREATTDFLFAFYRLQNVYEPIFSKIDEVLKETKTNSIVDCCSGSGGPIKRLREYLETTEHAENSITVTDKFPNHAVFELLEKEYPNKIFAHKDSLDVTNLPENLIGMRTLFSSFHHFSPPAALKILQNAVDRKMPIGIFEFTQRHPLELLRVLFSPLVLMCVLPLAKRMTFRKFFFTYILPITPFTHMWEYFVSCLRTYSPKELEALVKQVNAPDYHWDIGKIWSKQGMCHITYLIGYKKSKVDYGKKH